MTTTIDTDVCVIGAGAAGLWAAEVAARAGGDVVLIEKMPRTGTKVLVSGGTKCNLTTTLPGSAAAALFGPRGARFLRTAFRVVPPAAVRERFGAWGVETVTAPLEKIFPSTGKAVHVRDALERAAVRAGARIVLGAGVDELTPAAAGGWWVAAGATRVRAQRVIACPGGRSYASTGTTGDGYAWFAALGCALVPPVPALVPLTSPDPRITDLTGIAIQDVTARLATEEHPSAWLGERRRPVLFTHRGVSGPAAMDLSVHVARGLERARARGIAAPRFRLALDLLPDVPRERVRASLIAGAGAPGAPRVGRLLPIELPRRLLGAVLAQAGFDAEPRAAELGKAARHRLVETFKGWSIPIDGTLGFAKAEVTAGGLALEEVDPGTMAVRRAPGLFACGEILDLAGPIGGLNFQSAFATAELAALAATARS